MCEEFAQRDKIRLEKEKIQWILGDPAFWKGSMQEPYLLKTKGQVEWSYQPHSSYHFASEGKKENIIIFDNHWAKRRPVEGFAETEDSYVKIYEIDAVDKTVTMTKKYTTVKSKITSNPLLTEDKRVFAIGAFLEPRIENRGGMIDEFDYESGELFNRYSIRYFFYRGYPFEPDLDKLSECFPEVKYPAVGFLYKPQPVSKSVLDKKRYLLKELPEDEREKMEFRCTDNTLFLNAKDHQVEKVFFEGKREHITEIIHGRRRPRNGQKKCGIIMRFHYIC